MYWADDPHPWHWACRDGMPPVEDADVIAREEAAKKAAESDDASSVRSGAHGERLRGFGVRVAWLLAFTEALACWDWPTWRVVRDIIKPATEARGRRRFAELDEVAPHTGPATVFMSHCWGAEWGGLVMAACAGARCDRVVWIDVFAVRQWPGNGADLDFRGVIRGCTALVVAAPVIAGEISEGLMGNAEMAAFLASDAGAAAKKLLFAFRLWCVVELHAALEAGIPVVIRAGRAAREGDAVEFVTDVDAMKMLSHLASMID